MASQAIEDLLLEGLCYRLINLICPLQKLFLMLHALPKRMNVETCTILETMDLQLCHPIKFFPLFSGSRGLDIACLPLKLHPFVISNSCELESPITRKPFSPISSTDSSNSNATDVLEDLHKRHSEMLQKTLLTSNNTQFCTPPKNLPTTQEENRTPQTMQIHVPSTPSTVSIPMQMGLTPAPTNKSIEEEIEYSFEETRAGSVLRRQLHSMPV